MVTREGSIITLWTSGPQRVEKNFLGKHAYKSICSTKQTVLDIDNPYMPKLEYTKKILMALAIIPKPGNILTIGLGGGYIPMMLEHLSPGTKIEIVEIDKKIAKIAKKFFNLNTSGNLKLIIDDGSHFINHTKKKYDIIIQDAYLGGKVPQSLCAINFISETKRKLSRNGVLVANLFTSDFDHYQDMIQKIETLFNNLFYLPCIESGNTIILATDGNHTRPGIERRWQILKKDFPIDLD